MTEQRTPAARDAAHEQGEADQRGIEGAQKPRDFDTAQPGRESLSDTLSLLPLGQARRASVCNRSRDESTQRSRGGRARQDFRVRPAEESPRFVHVFGATHQEPMRLRET